MKRASLVLAAVVLALAPAAAQARKSTSKTKAASTKHVISRKPSSSRGRRGHVGRAHPAPSYQLHPDPGRYMQIQQALTERGYFKGTVDGQWNEDSVDSLRRFQTDQKLEADGKISALTLTALGLGPRHDGTTAGTVPLSAVDPVPQAPVEGPLPETESPPENSPQYLRAN